MACGPLIVLQYLGAKGRSAGPASSRDPRRRSAYDARGIGEQAGETTMRKNKIKEMWRAKKCVTLGWLSLSHGFIAAVMARQGFDALCVDLQHGTAEMRDVAPMLQAISQTDTVPVVRVAWNEPAAIMKALDLRAYAIIVPLVNTAQEAAMAGAACRYPPVRLPSNGPVRAGQHGGRGYVANAHDEGVVIAMIETKEGPANLDALFPPPRLHPRPIGPAHPSVGLGP